MSKATKAQSAERTTKVFELLVLGLSRAEIIQYCTEKTDWQVKERQVDVYIAKATARLQEQAAYQREEQLGIAINRLNKLYQSNLKVQDYKGALAVQRELNTLLGLHAPQEMRHTLKDWRTQVLEDVRNGTLTIGQVIAAFGGKEDLIAALGKSMAARLFDSIGVQAVDATE